VVYVGFLGSFLVALRLIGDNETGMTAVVSCLLVVKMSDIGAFAFGRLLGANKLAPRLSPGKTIEGAIGGVATACVVSWAFFRFAAPQMMPALADAPPTYLATMLYGLILAAAAMIGDLAESLLKRDMQQKDSSTWLRGLGGVLDIMDSVLIAAPAAYLCWQWGLIQ
jgi:phosphatidate cytidylyltransferase